MIERRTQPRIRLLTGALVVVLLAFLAVIWRINIAPDIFTDEILYTRAGIRVANEGAMIWDDGDPLFVHPPLYFLVEAVFLKLTAATESVMHSPGDIFAWVYHARWLNAIFAAFTAGLLYALGYRLGGPVAGVLAAALFILDPFGLRINRRAMLETMAVLLTMAGMALLLPRGQPVRPGRAILAGLVFGASMLTKELSFTALVALVIFWFWQRVREPEMAAANRPLLLTPVIASLTYLIFPLWAYSTGDWYRFEQVKLLSLRRLLGLVQITGWNRPGVSLLTFVQNRLQEYGTTYLLLAIGGLATLWLLAVRRDNPSARLLGIWGLFLYPFYAFLALFGAGNDQFFYFLLVPAILITSYAVSTLPGRLARVATIVLIVLFLPLNALLWWNTYGIGVDNSYARLTAYVEQNIPQDEPINATGDDIKFLYFFPNRTVTNSEEPNDAQDSTTRYYALAPKDVWAGYRTTPELAAWIQENGERVFAASGLSYGDLYLYRIDNPGDNAIDVEPLPRTFPPAERAYVGTLVAALMGLTALALGLALWLERKRGEAAKPAGAGYEGEREVEHERTQAYRV